MKKPANTSEVNGYIPTEMKRKFKAQCSVQGKTMSEVLTELVGDWLKKQEEEEKAS